MQAPSTPSEIFDRFERGEIDRDELHGLLALHARELIEEMEEDYRNPAAALVEYWLAKRLMRRLLRRHSRRLVREVLVALSRLPDFPPSRHLWNAGHPDVPLHCFLRMRREPVFRLLDLRVEGRDEVVVVCEYGGSGRGGAVRREVVLCRGEDWELRAQGGVG